MFMTGLMFRKTLLFLAVRTCSRCAAREEICGTASDQPLELVEDVRIPPAFGDFLFHRLQCIGDGKGRLIRPIGSQSVINIDDLQHSGGNWDGLSPKPIWIPRAIEFFVVVSNDRKHEAKGLQRRADALSNHRMLPDKFPFVWGQRLRLQQNCIWYRNFPTSCTIPARRRAIS